VGLRAGARLRSVRRALPALAFALWAVACAKAPPAVSGEGAPLLPALASRQDHVDALEVRVAGDEPKVSLRRVGGEWQVAQRAGWRADGARIAQFLQRLADARRVEAKTDRPVMYPRIGVEDVSDPNAGGSELRLSGKDVAARVVVGIAHGPSGGRFVRLAGEKRAWLCDTDVALDPDPVSWLDHRLLSIPLARVERVRVRPRTATAYSLVSREDRFRPDDAPPAAMHDSHAGDDIASALQAFDVDDVAADDGPKQASQALDYELVDGSVVTVSVWREGVRDWARVAAAFDEAQGAKWEGLSGKHGVQAQARAQVAQWTRRFAGRKFLLAPALAHTLTLDHSQVLEGGQAP
jgi:hypothetical protein